MSEKIKYFTNIDDDYLIGLSNKGIVKRSYKDLENANVAITENDECIDIALEDVSCQLYIPLGDSKCSCPSRSMCKHIVMGAIAVKRKYEAGGADAGQGASGSGDDGAGQGASMPSGTAECQAGQVLGSATTEQAETSFPELDSYTLDKIKKQLGASAFRRVCQRMRIAEEPSITITSVVTVAFGDTEATVKLLEPVEYSTCSCHKKELCQHKAEAIIAYQLHKGLLTKEKLDLVYEDADNQEFDIEEIKNLAANMRQLLGEIIFTGLARVSTDMADSCERMAIMCHNALLANFESDFRRLSEKLNKYFTRHASADAGALMHYVCQLYGRVVELDGVASKLFDKEDGTTATHRLQQLAGRFRSEYELTKPLSLMGMGQRHFVSQAGFEGETIYFLEEEGGDWYTYTNARPTIYDNRGARGINANSSAPWGLNFSLDTLSEHRIRLTNGRVSQGNRLSSTSQATAELIGNRNMSLDAIKAHTYSDFGRLFDDLFGNYWQEKSDEDSEVSHFAIVRPHSVEEADFDNIKQAFYMRLLDEQGQCILIKLTYTKEDKYIINHLERLHRRIKEGRRAVPDFFGRLYIEDGELRMYPIEYYDAEEVS